MTFALVFGFVAITVELSALVALTVRHRRREAAAVRRWRGGI